MSSPAASGEASTQRAVAQALVPMVLGAALAIAAVGLLAVVAALAAGERALVGALVGGLAVVGVLLFGVLTLALVVRVIPESSLLVAMLIYVAQVTVLFALYVRYEKDAVFRDAASAPWIAGGIAAGTIAWVLGQVLGGWRARHETTGVHSLTPVSDED